MTQLIRSYCNDNILLLPASFYEMDDATTIMTDGNAAIFHKLIHQDMRDVEFFTNMPCLAFVVRGQEAFSTADHDEVLLNSGEMLFMSRELYMISDFVNDAGPLEAFLFFFDESVVSDFLRRAPLARVRKSFSDSPYKVNANAAISHFIQGLQGAYDGVSTTQNLLRTKLLELLFLIEAVDDAKRLRGFLTSTSMIGGKRNIKHLMRDHTAHNLTVKDFAALSGRSISSFNRDFKRQFGIPPSKWLIEMRLEQAKEMIVNSSISVTDVAMAAGYSNTSHFIKVFKTHYGNTPKQMRLELV